MPSGYEMFDRTTSRVQRVPISALLSIDHVRAENRTKFLGTFQKEKLEALAINDGGAFETRERNFAKTRNQVPL